MACLLAEGLGFSFVSTAPIIQDAHLRLEPGWTGLVGPNGAGKSTLLSLLAGQRRPDEGHVRREPPGAGLAVLGQRAELSEGLRNFANGTDREASRLRGVLALQPSELRRWSTLSYGEQKRWQLGSVLYQAPQILLLDEPTNHLDEAGGRWLLEVLSGLRVIGLIVSHDRILLDALTERTLYLEQGALEDLPGPYSAALAEREVRRRSAQARREQQQQRAQRAERTLDSARRRLVGADQQRVARRRMKGPQDKDGSSMNAKARAEFGAAAHSRSVARLALQAERAEAEVAQTVVPKTLGASVFARYEPSPKPVLATVPAGSISVGGIELLRTPALLVERSDRIWIRGANGAGKSTLLGALVGGLRVPRDRILYLPQESTPKEAQALLAEVRQAPAELKGRTLSVVAALGVDPGALLASPTPSPGEGRKLAIALALGRHAHALFLDEPSNHLDLPSVERLTEALSAFPGALVVVSHDPQLAGRITDQAWEVCAGQVAPS